KALALPTHMFSKQRVGEIYTRLAEVASIRQATISKRVSIASDVFLILLIIAVLFFYGLKVALITMSAIPFALGIHYLFRKKTMTSLNSIFEEQSQLNS